MASYSIASLFLNTVCLLKFIIDEAWLFSSVPEKSWIE